MAARRHPTSYDPEVQPDGTAWLSMPGDQRLRSVATFHMVHRERNGNQKAHAAMHLAVEDQIARGFGPTVRAMQRLQSEGLSRHDAIHAVASVLAEQLYSAAHAETRPDSASLQEAINKGIDHLSAETWKSKHGSA